VSTQNSCRSGDYGHPPQWRVWFSQLVVWLLIVSTSKLMLIGTVIHTLPWIAALVDFVFSPLRQYPDFELVLVMVVFPVAMNALLFWVTDNVIKRRHDHTWSASQQRQHDEEANTLVNELHNADKVGKPTGKEMSD
jgi:hypothetical protein